MMVYYTILLLLLLYRLYYISVLVVGGRVWIPGSSDQPRVDWEDDKQREPSTEDSAGIDIPKIPILCIYISPTHFPVFFRSWIQVKPTTTSYRLSSSTKATTRWSSRPTFFPLCLHRKTSNTATSAVHPFLPLPPPLPLSRYVRQKKRTAGKPQGRTSNRGLLAPSWQAALKALHRTENHC